MNFCTVELFRERKHSYSAISFNVELDGETVCRLRNGESARFLAAPGMHELRIYSIWGCIGSLTFTIQAGQQCEYITILIPFFSRRVTFAHGCFLNQQPQRDSAASALFWLIAILILVPLLLYLTGIIRPFVFFFPLR